MSARGLQIRPVGPRDSAAIAALHGPSFRHEPWDQAAVAQVLALEGCFGFLARREQDDAGFVLARCVACECEILAVAVARPWRRHGLGRGLLRAAVGRAPLLGAEIIHLEVAEDNAAARALYLAEGFQAVGRRADYYLRGQNPRVAAILYSRQV